MSENRFTVHSLPTGSATQLTDQNNEIAFRFVGVICAVDKSDGSFLIKTNFAEHTKWHSYNDHVLNTGHVDTKGAYTFSEKSSWTKNNTERSARSDADLTYYDSPSYFKNDIGMVIRQRKLCVFI